MATYHTEKFFKEQSKKYDLPIPTIRLVSNFPFKVIREVIEDPTNSSDVLLSRFCRVGLKHLWKADKTISRPRRVKQLQDELRAKGIIE